MIIITCFNWLNKSNYKYSYYFHCYFYRYRILQIVLRERTYRQLPQFTFLDVSIFGVSTLYMLVFLLCSVLSLVFVGYFYCVCLLFIIFTSDILQRVLRSVTKHGNWFQFVLVHYHSFHHQLHLIVVLNIIYFTFHQN